MGARGAEEPLRAAAVGCRMGRGHARCMSRLPEYELVAVVDIVPERARAVADALDVAGCYADYAEMLAGEQPEVVAVATPNTLHAEMTIQAVEAGARGVYCEKPMAVGLGQAHRMVEACRARGVALAVNHQRRLGADLVRMRELIAEGAIGELRLLRGYHAGDILSDGTHVVDTLRHLNGDAPARWVFGQVHRSPLQEELWRGHQSAARFWRFGHAVEAGGFAVIEFGNRVRAEILSGDLRPPASVYCEFEAIGTEGRLWRPGDRGEPPLSINAGDGWQEVPLPERARGEAMEDGYRRFARMVRDGEPHPLGAESALADHELVMAIYESARTRRKVGLPLAQHEFPLDLMIQAGQL